MFGLSTSRNDNGTRIDSDSQSQRIPVGALGNESHYGLYSLSNLGSFLKKKKVLLQNHNNMMKRHCKAAASWGWEMLGTLYVMVESFGGMKDNLQLCLKKMPKQSDACADDTQSDSGEQRQSPRYILVLDLDETLIHSDLKRFNADDFEVTVKVGNDLETYYVRKRPYLQQFLEKLSEIFELYVFTAALREYADKIIDWIDPNGYIKKRFYRDHCTKKDGTFYKDLTKVNPDLTKVFIIDNSTSGFSMNPENGMLIKSWYYDLKDYELKQYTKFLTDNASPNKARKWQEGNIRNLLDYLKQKYPRHVLN